MTKTQKGRLVPLSVFAPCQMSYMTQCVAKTDTCFDTKKVRERFQSNVKSTPARVAEQIITEYFEKEELDIDELNSLVDSVVDGVKMSNCKAK